MCSYTYLLLYISPLDSGQHQEYFTNAGSEYGLFVEFNMTFAHYVSPTGVHTGLVVSVQINKVLFI